MVRSFLLAWFLISASASFAEDGGKRPLVVELYTSQGCSSCPPADAMLTELAKRDDVIALGFHVDYWDYLGWKDEFAHPDFAKRQATINKRLMSRYKLVTPQMIFNGLSEVSGAHETAIEHQIEKHSKSPKQIGMDASRSADGTVQISLEPHQGQAGICNIYVAELEPANAVEIRRGENAGETITYTNVVTGFRKIGTWDGREAFELTTQVKNDRPVVVLVQEQGLGPIVAARQLP